MIHFITVHFQTDRWIRLQLAQIARHTTGEYRVWASIEGIDPSSASAFDEVFEFSGSHPEKLNLLAERVLATAAPDDLMVFIDGDAFPIADIVPPVSRLLAHYPLIAVCRVENMGDCQPHPCFAVTTVRLWREIGGDWTIGTPPYTEWTTTYGLRRTDAGALLMANLAERGIPWCQLLRSNVRDLHPVMFGVYGNLVYHHGSGFRNPDITLDMYESGWLRWRGVPRGVGWLRMKRRAHSIRKLSEYVFGEISRDVDAVRRIFLDTTSSSVERVALRP